MKTIPVTITFEVPAKNREQALNVLFGGLLIDSSFNYAVEKFSKSTCPYCAQDTINHGYCTQCKRFCGCSFNPVSRNDFCSYHGG